MAPWALDETDRAALLRDGVSPPTKSPYIPWYRKAKPPSEKYINSAALMVQGGIALSRGKGVEVDVPDDTPSLFRQPNLDGRGPNRFVQNDDLPALTPRPLEPGE